MSQGLLEVCNHKDSVTVLLFNLSLESALLNGHKVVVQDARAEDDLQRDFEEDEILNSKINEVQS